MYKDTEKAISKLTSQYGEAMIRMGISHLMDVGIRNLTDENITEAKAEIKADDEKARAEGKHPFMTPEFQYTILDVAKELAQLPHIELLVYVQENLYFDVGQNTMSKSRMESCLQNSILMLHDNLTQDFKDTMNEIGIDEDVLEQLGLEPLIENDEIDYCED